MKHCETLEHSPFDATISPLPVISAIAELVLLHRYVTELLIMEIWVLFPNLLRGLMFVQLTLLLKVETFDVPMAANIDAAIMVTGATFLNIYVNFFFSNLCISNSLLLIVM